MKDKVYLEKWGLLFKRDSTGYFIPYKYDVKYDKATKRITGKKIGLDSKDVLGRCMFDFIMFAKASGVETDSNTGQEKEGYLDIYQYIIAFATIKRLLLLDSSDVIAAIARQAKISGLYKLL